MEPAGITPKAGPGRIRVFELERIHQKSER
jgi:hypothetical protein